MIDIFSLLTCLSISGYAIKVLINSESRSFLITHQLQVEQWIIHKLNGRGFETVLFIVWQEECICLSVDEPNHDVIIAVSSANSYYQIKHDPTWNILNVS